MLNFDPKTQTVSGTRVKIQKLDSGYMHKWWSHLGAGSSTLSAKEAFQILRLALRETPGGDEEQCLQLVQALGWSDMLDDALASWEAHMNVKHATYVRNRLGSERDYDRFRGTSQQEIQAILIEKTGNPPSSRMQAWQIVQERERREAWLAASSVVNDEQSSDQKLRQKYHDMTVALGIVLSREDEQEAREHIEKTAAAPGQPELRESEPAAESPGTDGERYEVTIERQTTRFYPTLQSAREAARAALPKLVFIWDHRDGCEVFNDYPSSDDYFADDEFI